MVDSDGEEKQRDIVADSNVEEDYTQNHLRETVDYKKSEFNLAEEEIMECMITLIEERRSRRIVS